MNTWRQLLDDKRVWLGPLGKSRGFKYFVDVTVPEILEEYSEVVATFELWIEIQYKIATALADISTEPTNEKIARRLSDYKDKYLFLALRNTTEEGYALQMRGLPEVVLQTLAFSLIVCAWYRNPRRSWAVVMGVLAVLVVLISAAGIFAPRPSPQLEFRSLRPATQALHGAEVLDH